jgi:hypothetical protein
VSCLSVVHASAEYQILVSVAPGPRELGGSNALPDPRSGVSMIYLSKVSSGVGLPIGFRCEFLRVYGVGGDEPMRKDQSE